MEKAKEPYSVIEKSGSWFHDDAVPHEVLIVRQNFDSGLGEKSSSSEKLNENGEVFHVQFCRDGSVELTSKAFMSLTEAVAFAESQAPNPVNWDGDVEK